MLNFMKFISLYFVFICTLGCQKKTDVEMLLEGLNDKHIKIRQSCAQELGEKKVKVAVKPLIMKLSESSGIQWDAARSLGLIGDTSAIDALSENLFTKPDSAFNRMAAWALAELCAKEKLGLLQEIENNDAQLSKMVELDIKMLKQALNKIDNCD